MPVISVASQPSGLAVGILSLVAGEQKPFTDAVWYDTEGAASPPKECRGVTVRVRSGTVRIGGSAVVAANEGYTIAATNTFGDDIANGVSGWYAVESAGGAAVVEIICRTGGVS